MKMSIFFFIGIFVNTVYGQDQCDFKNANDLLNRIKENHPLVLEAELQSEAQLKLIDISKQRPNPNLDAEMLFGDTNSEFAADTLFSLQHTFELGGKRSARIKSAEAQIQMSELQKRNVSESVVINTVMKLYQLQQLEKLTSLYNEAIETFQHMRKRLKRLPSLSPQQQIEMDTLELASSSYGFNVIQKKAERNAIERYLMYFSGCSSINKENILPSASVLISNTDMFTGVANSVQVLDAKQVLDIAQTQLAQENAKKTPNLSLGPAVGYGRSQGTDSLLFGAALSMPLPLLNKNKGNRAFENANVKKATLAFQNVEQKTLLDLEIWKQKYLRYYQSLHSIEGKESMEIKHRRLESLFRRGVVPANMVIEAHRQLIDFSQMQLSVELEAIEALWNIYRLTGNLDKETL
ncbi:MAG: TolC family protein [Deltaproteobacteria bacterium]|nr:TolC family protein [Deltaproteobacteria bacterium]